MVPVITEFCQAVSNLQKVFQGQQRAREFNRSARSYYREQKARTLQDLSRYEFLFSESYHRLQECGSNGNPLDLRDLEIRTIIQAGRSYQETYREISKAFDRRIREAGAINRKDPSGSLKNIKRCEKKILPLFNDFKDRVKAELNAAIDLSTVSSKLSAIADEILLYPGRAIIEEEIPDAYRLGDNFGSIQLNIAKKRQKKESYSDFIKPKPERQLDWKKIADIIERTIGDFQGISDEVNKRIRKSISDGVINEKSLWEIEESVLDVIGSIGADRARMMVHHEIQDAVNKGIELRYKDAEVEELEWLANSDDIVCDECEALDGQKFPIDDHPDNPGHVYCRCTWIPVIKIPEMEEEE